MPDLITILGPTASGKTAFAAALANKLDTEIISADSRQVYQQMDIGTGKDLADYIVNDKQIPCHLIDIVPAGYKYNLFEYKKDFEVAYKSITQKGKIPVLCGGTGLYIEAVLNDYTLMEVPENAELRKKLEGKNLEELTQILSKYRSLHNKTDVDTVKRAVRAIEIADFQQQNTVTEQKPTINSLIIGHDISREERRNRISARLKERLENGMIDEVRRIMESGVAADDLIYYGLEYKFVTNYLLGNLTYEQMFSQLEVAIHQFAKRQMTWFRGMEKRGFTIHWINACLPQNEKIEKVLKYL